MIDYEYYDEDKQASETPPQRRERKENEAFEPIWKSMTDEEKNALLRLSVGLPTGDGSMVYGIYALNTLKEFREDMVKKYSK